MSEEDVSETQSADNDQTAHDCVCYVSNLVNDPVTVAEALSRSDRSKSIEAMKKEYDSLMRSETWVLVDKPDGANVVPCKWVFKITRDQNGVPSPHYLQG